jgi:hypothetical protein
VVEDATMRIMSGLKIGRKERQEGAIYRYSNVWGLPRHSNGAGRGPTSPTWLNVRHEYRLQPRTKSIRGCEYSQMVTGVVQWIIEQCIGHYIMYEVMRWTIIEFKDTSIRQRTFAQKQRHMGKHPNQHETASVDENT